MMRDEIISRIRDHAEAIRALGAESLYLYGSHARNEANPASDVDVFIDRNPTKRFTFIELTELEFLLKEILGAEVDLSTRTALHPGLSRDIENTAIKVL
jgi:predicted nucleotidyltransferase